MIKLTRVLAASCVLTALAIAFWLLPNPISTASLKATHGTSHGFRAQEAASSSGQDFLTQRLAAEDQAQLLRDVESSGDPRRGALVFFRGEVGCVKCHEPDASGRAIGPVLSRESKETSATELIRAILEPSATIKKGFETITLVTDEGQVLSGQVIEERDGVLQLRDLQNADRILSVPVDTIEDRAEASQSLMPDGLANVLRSRQEFLDLASYVIEIAQHGSTRAAELRPADFLITKARVPEYEANIDHAGLIRDWNEQSLERGQAIYERLCINCHGTVTEPGSLPTSLRFASGKFKNGSDPYQMYQTLTHGFNLMVPQSWMVPQQKYDVIHFIREAYLKPHNPSQYTQLTDEYLASLPQGSDRGPEPQTYEPWVAMNYGPTMAGTFEFGDDGTNLAYKGIAVRLDDGPGGISQGRHWLIFDHDTMRVAGVWTGTGFIDWNGIHFNGRHAIHPRVVGDIQFENPIGPGWGRPEDGSFEDPRFHGRDDKPYGPLPRDWVDYRGLYHYGNRAIFDYTVGQTEVYEMPGLESIDNLDVYSRTFNLGPRSEPLILQVANVGRSDWKLSSLESDDDAFTSSSIRLHSTAETSAEESQPVVTFDGTQWLEVNEGDAFEMTEKDFTLLARVKTKTGGTLFAKTQPDSDWVPNGKTLFIRGGRLCYDIGWVGVIQSRKALNDGRWHTVALTYRADDGRVQLFIDGERQAEKELRPKEPVNDHRVRIGFTSPNFPSESNFVGELNAIRFDQRLWTAEEIAGLQNEDDALLQSLDGDHTIAAWNLQTVRDGVIPNVAASDRNASLRQGTAVAQEQPALLLAVSHELANPEWRLGENGELRLVIPAGDKPLNFKLSLATSAPEQIETAMAAFHADQLVHSDAYDLAPLLAGGPPRWEVPLQQAVQCESTSAPYAVDVFEHPVNNPWQAQVRLSGFDFFEDSDRMAVCSWDGDVWLVDGLHRLPRSPEQVADQPVTTVTWRRIASGLFQPLGLKIVDGNIYLTCRDQLVILRDLNGDQETDFYECFNNDQQVTEHFHEFAMGLQVDDEGNFYYAKSARHALPALVPHHGTLLRVSPDGSETEIIANGFRAANGVCLNPDGTFIVTDQEGHWNPKNRINWVKKGGFYGNMFGYHDVTDSSDEAMEQPLCWITNAFDRSPAELLWVDSTQWGPLEGRLLNLSYGYGKIFVVPYEEINGQVQGGMSPLPIGSLPTGVMRGRFHPDDGQLYACGMFAWAGNATQPGGFYRIRYTGAPACLPVELHARTDGMQIGFTGQVQRESALNPDNYAVKVWALKRTANYGSQHYDEHPLKIESVDVSGDGKTVTLRIPDLSPTWCMEIQYRIRTSDGKPLEGVIHNTIHTFGSEH